MGSARVFHLRHCRMVGVAALVASVAVLSGCSETDRFGVRLVDGDYNFRFCEPMDFDEVRVKSGPIGAKPSELMGAWAALGEAGSPRDDIVYGIAPLGMANDLGPIAFDGSKTIVQIEVYHHHDGDLLDARQAAFDLSLASESSWLNASGRLVDDPCALE